MKITDLVIVGGGSHSRVLISIIKNYRSFNLIGYTDVKNLGVIDGVDYLGNDSILEKLLIRNNNFKLVMGLGKLDLGRTRNNLFYKYKDFFLSIVAPSAVVSENVKIGNGTVIINSATINTGTSIGENSIINTSASIDHECNIGNDTHIAPGVVLSGNVKIGNNCFIGTGAIVIQNCEIFDNVIVGAGSTVIKDIIESGTYVGSPVRKIK